MLNEINITGSVPVSFLEQEYRRYVTVIPKNLLALKELIKQSTLVCFNNSSKEWMDYRRKTFHLDEYFSSYVTSGYTGILKPEKEAFEIVLATCASKDSLYIDDNREYIKKAKQYGLDAMVYEQGLLDQLREK